MLQNPPLRQAAKRYRAFEDTKTDMKFSWKIKTFAIMVLIACYIMFPFFKIDYFETRSSLRIIYNYLLIPILCIASLGTIFVYIKYLRQPNPKLNSKIKVFFQDLFLTVFLSGIISAILIGMTVSTIVTTNVYGGHSKDVWVIGTVLKYSANTNKNGRLRHRIEFVSSYDNKIKNLEVYRKYEIGEEFKKEMKIGIWGQLYSID